MYPQLQRLSFLLVAMVVMAALVPRETQAEDETAPLATESPFFAELSDGLGTDPASILRMKFEVTFMKFDVANLEARLGPGLADQVGRIVGAAEKPELVYGPIADLLLAGSPQLLTMAYLRDSDFDRFQKGIRAGMKAARESGVIEESDEAALLSILEEDMAPVEARTVFKGDALAYLVDGDSVRTVYLGGDGEVVVDVTRDEPLLARALVASWFGEESRFRKKLLESLF